MNSQARAGPTTNNARMATTRGTTVDAGVLAPDRSRWVRREHGYEFAARSVTFTASGALIVFGRRARRAHVDHLDDARAF
jgi:hypothetical protein